jgi:hypothetical protein
MIKKHLTKQLLKNQTCETCVKRIASHCPTDLKLTCKEWTDWEIWDSYLFIVMSREAFQTLNRTLTFKKHTCIKSIEIFDYDGSKLGEIDRHDISVSPEDTLTIKHVR